MARMFPQCFPVSQTGNIVSGVRFCFQDANYAYAIDAFNKSNVYSFPLSTTFPAFDILLKIYSFNDVNSGKLYILDLLKGSIHGREF